MTESESERVRESERESERERVRERVRERESVRESEMDSHNGWRVASRCRANVAQTRQPLPSKKA